MNQAYDDYWLVWAALQLLLFLLPIYFFFNGNNPGRHKEELEKERLQNRALVASQQKDKDEQNRLRTELSQAQAFLIKVRDEATAEGNRMKLELSAQKDLWQRSQSELEAEKNKAEKLRSSQQETTRTLTETQELLKKSKIEEEVRAKKVAEDRQSELNALERVKKQLETMTSQESQLQRDLDAAKKNAAELLATQTEASQNLKNKEAEISELEHALKESRQEREAEAIRAQAAIASQQQASSELELSRQELLSERQKAQSSKEMREKLEAEMKAVSASLCQLREELVSAKASAAETDAKEKATSDLLAQANSGGALVRSELSTAIEKGKSDSATISRLEEELALSKANAATLTSSCQSSEAKAVDLEKRVQALSASAAVVVEQENALASLTTANASLEAEKDDLANRLAEKETTVRELEDTLKASLNGLRQEKEKADQDLQRLKATVTALERAQEDKSNLEQDRSRLESALEAMKADFALIEAQNIEFQKRLASQEDAQNLHLALEQLRAEFERLAAAKKVSDQLLEVQTSEAKKAADSMLAELSLLKEKTQRDSAVRRAVKSGGNELSASLQLFEDIEKDEELVEELVAENNALIKSLRAELEATKAELAKCNTNVDGVVVAGERFNFQPEIIDNSDGAYHVTYPSLLKPGNYEVAVEVNNETHAFPLNVDQAPDPSEGVLVRALLPKSGKFLSEILPDIAPESRQTLLQDLQALQAPAGENESSQQGFRPAKRPIPPTKIPKIVRPLEETDEGPRSPVFLRPASPARSLTPEPKEGRSILYRPGSPARPPTPEPKGIPDTKIPKPAPLKK